MMKNYEMIHGFKKNNEILKAFEKKNVNELRKLNQEIVD